MASGLELLSDVGHRIAEASRDVWGPQRPTLLLGVHESLLRALRKVLQFGPSDSPVLITGETGTGKELFARSLYLLSPRRKRPFLSVNCAQFQDPSLLISELFGHKKGSFTGAVADRRGIFEEAASGVVFLDEVGELPPTAQAMLLRALGEGEICRLGESTPRQVDVRVVAATNRDLKKMVVEGSFRQDLYYRLRFLQVQVPPLRERGHDWKLLVEHYLASLGGASERSARFSDQAVEMLGRYPWPGNVRELKGIVDMAFHTAGGGDIEPDHFADELEWGTGVAVPVRTDARADVPAGDDRYARMTVHGETFWNIVYTPFMDRELNRHQVRQLLSKGLSDTRGSYKRLLPAFGIAPHDYLRFMDFLRHHRLKPER